VGLCDAVVSAAGLRWASALAARWLCATCATLLAPDTTRIRRWSWKACCVMELRIHATCAPYPRPPLISLAHKWSGLRVHRTDRYEDTEV
jgi:hypothetical protein